MSENKMIIIDIIGMDIVIKNYPPLLTASTFFLFVMIIMIITIDIG